MNVKRLTLAKLAWARPVHIKAIRLYRKRWKGHVVQPPEWKISLSPKPPKGAVSWVIEGDELVLTSHHPCVYIGYVRVIQGLAGLRTSMRSLLIRRRRFASSVLRRL